MKKIMVAYWHSNWKHVLGFEHKQEFEYTKRKRNWIVDKVLNAGLKVMLYPIDDTLVIWIDDKRFIFNLNSYLD